LLAGNPVDGTLNDLGIVLARTRARAHATYRLPIDIYRQAAALWRVASRA
jgi:hypothetical protein